MAAQLGFTRIFFDCNLCCDAEELDICEFIAENCPGGGELDTNFLEDDLTQDAPRTHNFAGFSHTWNSVGALTWDNDGDIVFVNAFVQDDTQTHILVRNSTTGRVEYRDASTLGGADTNFLEDDLTQDANRTHNFAGFNHVWNSVGQVTWDNDGDIIFVNPFVQDDTQTDLLVRNSTTGRLEFRDVSSISGGADTNFLEDNLTQDANRTHNFAGFSHTWNSVGAVTWDNDGDIVFVNPFVNDDTQTHILVRNNVSGRIEYRLASTLTGIVDLCDADGDTCFVNEETADEDWIRFTIGITDVRTFAGFINETNSAYGRGAGDAITTKTGDNSLFGKDAGGDLTTGILNTFVGSGAGLGTIDGDSNIAIGEDAMAGEVVVAGSGPTNANLVIGERAYQGAASGGSLNIVIGLEAMQGVGDMAPGGGGPDGMIAIGNFAMQAISDENNANIAIGTNSLALLQFGSDNVVIGEDAGNLLVGVQATDEMSLNVLIGDGAGGIVTTDAVNSVCVGWRAGSVVDINGLVAIGWSACTSGSGTPIPSTLGNVAIGASSGISMGGNGNVAIGQASGRLDTASFPANDPYAATNSGFIGTGSWCGKTDLLNGWAIGSDVGVIADDTLILGFQVDFDGIAPDNQLKVGIGTQTPAADLHVVATASGGIRYVTGQEGLDKVLASDADGDADWADAEVIIRATVSTTDATTTTCGLITTATDQMYHVESRVTSRHTTLSDAGDSWKIIGTFKNDGGVLTQVGTTTVDHDSGTTASTVVFDVSGVDIRVRVTGIAATDIDWKSRTTNVPV